MRSAGLRLRQGGGVQLTFRFQPVFFGETFWAAILLPQFAGAAGDFLVGGCSGGQNRRM
jgi:hypothetical protein